VVVSVPHSGQLRVEQINVAINGKATSQTTVVVRPFLISNGVTETSDLKRKNINNINTFTAGHLHRLNNNKKTTHNTNTKSDKLSQTFSEQETLIALFIFTKY
jgi:hypothetical protein